MATKTQAEEVTPPEGPRSLSRLLATLSDGELEAEGSYELHELTKRLQELALTMHAKAKGKLKLVLSFIADDNGVVNINYTIDVVAPKKRTTSAVYWLTPGGNLSSTNTKQASLQFGPREVPAEPETREPPAALPAKEA